MADLGSATLKITTDTSPVENTLRTIAKHFTALADELRATRTLSAAVDEYRENAKPRGQKASIDAYPIEEAKPEATEGTGY